MDHKTEFEICEDESGIVNLAIRAPGQVAAQPNASGVISRRGSASGNPQFDPATGRFAGSGSTKQSQVPDIQVVDQANRTLPQGVTKEQWERRLDVIREIARKQLEYDDKSLKTFLKGHPNVQNIDSIDIVALAKDIRAQQVDDLVDIMDTQLKSRVDVAGNVRIQAPTGWIKKAVARFSDEEILDVAKRLEGRGFGPEVISKQLVAKVTDKERRTKLEQLYGEGKK